MHLNISPSRKLKCHCSSTPVRLSEKNGGELNKSNTSNLLSHKAGWRSNWDSLSCPRTGSWGCWHCVPRVEPPSLSFYWRIFRQWEWLQCRRTDLHSLRALSVSRGFPQCAADDEGYVSTSSELISPATPQSRAKSSVLVSSDVFYCNYTFIFI